MKTKTTIVKKEEQMDEDNPAVLAYRVGQLEIAVNNVGSDLRQDIKDLKENFASKSEVSVLRTNVTNLVKQVNGIEKKRWVQNTLSAILGVVLAILIQGYFSK